MPAMYDVAAEDGQFTYYNCAVSGGVTLSTSAGRYRTTANAGAIYARYGISISGAISGVPYMQRLWNAGGQSTAWVSARVYFGTPITGATANTFFGLVDSSGVLRIGFSPTNGASVTSNFTVTKYNAAGTATVLGTSSSSFSLTPALPDKLDVNFNYSTSGSLTVYINGSQVFTYAGDITTDGTTSLGGYRFSGWGIASGGGSISEGSWSEVMCSPSSTKNFSLVTTAANAAGTLDQWTGAYTNVNGFSQNSAVFDYTASANQVQRYKMSGITAGAHQIVTVADSLICTSGGGTLTHLASVKFISGTQFFSSQKSLPASFAELMFFYDTCPSTSAQWTDAILNSTTLESGYESLA